MTELLSRLKGPEVIGFFSAMSFFLVIAIALVTGTWAWVRHAEFRVRQAEIEAALKQDMLNRGMSADDIERVVKASSGDGPTACLSDSAASRELAGYKRPPVRG